jgi:hypothetical protein
MGHDIPEESVQDRAEELDIPGRLPSCEPSPHSRRLRNWHIFAALSGATIAVAFFTNRVILTDDVYRAFLPEATGDVVEVETLLRTARRLEVLGYLAAPLLLLGRITLHALLVQLVMLLQGVQAPLGRVFRAAMVAWTAVWMGTALQAGWLASLPAGAVTPALAGQIPGTLTTLFPSLHELGWPLSLLFEEITVFHLGWVVLFALALEDEGRIQPRVSLVAVVTVWAATTLARWGALLYLSGF